VPLVDFQVGGATVYAEPRGYAFETADGDDAGATIQVERSEPEPTQVGEKPLSASLRPPSV